MKKTASQKGFVLPMTLLLLSCTLLWGSVLLLTLSDEYAASNESVAREQSRLLAYSGWNMALQQLETTGSLEVVQMEQTAGTVQVSLQREPSGVITIQSTANAKEISKKVQGKVRLLTLPWQEPATWPVIMNMQTMLEPGILFTNRANFVLAEHCDQPLVISRVDELPLMVQVTQPVTMHTLYVNGDLLIEAPLQAEAVYVSGAIFGAEQLTSMVAAENYSTEPGYHVDVLERSL